MSISPFDLTINIIFLSELPEPPMSLQYNQTQNLTQSQFQPLLSLSRA